MKFEDDEVEGKVHEIDVENDENMLVCACYIAECLVFKKELDFSAKGV